MPSCTSPDRRPDVPAPVDVAHACANANRYADHLFTELGATLDAPLRLLAAAEDPGGGERTERWLAEARRRAQRRLDAVFDQAAAEVTYLPGTRP